MYGAEIWGLGKGWKETSIIHGRDCKEILGIPRCASNRVAVLELGRYNRRAR
jgi:hypothetical protein